MAKNAPERLALVRDAIDVVLRRLADLAPSPEVDAVRQLAEKYQREADAWAHANSTVEEQEALMKRVLGLHIAVAKLERAREVMRPRAELGRSRRVEALRLTRGAGNKIQATVNGARRKLLSLHSSSFDPPAGEVFVDDGSCGVVHDGNAALAVLARELGHGNSLDECEIDPNGVVAFGDHAEDGTIDVHRREGGPLTMI